MNQEHIEALLDRYLKKETTTEETQLIEKWLAENGNIDSEWLRLDRGTKDQWLSEVFAEIKDSIAETEPKLVQLNSKRHFWYKVAGAAAVLMIFLSFYLGWPNLQKSMFSPPLTAITVSDHQKQRVKLPDGSEVWINEGSELKYPKDFSGKSREVYLSGEAYFDVRHDDAKPFLIHTGKVITRVLGTAFNIKEDQTRHTIEVTVTRGKVSVSNGTRQLGVITPNQQLSFNVLENKSVQTEIDAREVIAWQNEDMLFEDITFAEAALQLQQRFHVRINFSNDKIKRCRFSGTTLTGQKLDKILTVICTFNGAAWQTMPDGSIMIDGSGCN